MSFIKNPDLTGCTHLTLSDWLLPSHDDHDYELGHHGHDDELGQSVHPAATKVFSHTY